MNTIASRHGVGRKREVLVTTTTHDAAAGSGIQFSEAGEYELKGLAGAMPALSRRA